MCIATIAAVGAAVSAVGAVSSGIAQGQAASYQAQVARNNSVIAQQNAAHAAQAGAAETEAAGLKARARLATTRAGLAANNLDVTGGSAADVLSGEQKAGQLDTATVSNNAALQVYGYKTQGAGYAGQAKLDQAEAAFDPIAGVLKGAGGLASAAPSFGSLLGGDPEVPDSHDWMRGGALDSSPGDLSWGG